MAVAPAWNAWMGAVVPSRVRARYFARRQAACQVGVLLGLVGGGLVLELATRADAVRAGFVILFAVALACRGTSASLLHAQSLPPHNPRPAAIDLREIVGRAWRSPRRAVILCLVTMTGAVNVAGPFLPSHLLIEGRMPYGAYTATLAAFLVGKIVTYRVLGRLSRRLDVKLLLLGGGLLIAPLPLLWVVSTDARWMVGAQLVSGVGWAAFELGTILSFLDVGDDVEQTSLLSVYYALNSAAAAVASMIGASIFARYGAGAEAYRVIFVLCAGARVLALALLLHHARREAVRALPAILSFAIRPWGGGVIRPVLATFGLARGEQDDEPP
jgi:MFS family permease